MHVDAQLLMDILVMHKQRLKIVAFYESHFSIGGLGVTFKNAGDCCKLLEILEAVTSSR